MIYMNAIDTSQGKIISHQFCLKASIFNQTTICFYYILLCLAVSFYTGTKYKLQYKLLDKVSKIITFIYHLIRYSEHVINFGMYNNFSEFICMK